MFNDHSDETGVIMCGRFTLILEPEEVQNELHLGKMPEEVKPRFNIAPSQPIAVVTDPQTRDVQLFRWGLIPFWAKDPAIGNRMINARSETLAEKPAFKTALARRRCLILADGFYEWFHPEGRGPEGKSKGKTSSPSIPYLFRLASGKPFAFAGLWDTWRSPEGETISSCTIITTTANEHLSRFHERMPVILDQDNLWKWLKPEATIPEVTSLLIPYPSDQMASHPVSPKVNSPAFDTPECILPLVENGEDQ